MSAAYFRRAFGFGFDVYRGPLSGWYIDIYLGPFTIELETVS